LWLIMRFQRLALHIGDFVSMAPWFKARLPGSATAPLLMQFLE
jgi:hypothetical protein